MIVIKALLTAFLLFVIYRLYQIHRWLYVPFSKKYAHLTYPLAIYRTFAPTIFKPIWITGAMFDTQMKKQFTALGTTNHAAIAASKLNKSLRPYLENVLFDLSNESGVPKRLIGMDIVRCYYRRLPQASKQCPDMVDLVSRYPYILSDRDTTFLLNKILIHILHLQNGHRNEAVEDTDWDVATLRVLNGNVNCITNKP